MEAKELRKLRLPRKLKKELKLTMQFYFGGKLEKLTKEQIKELERLREEQLRNNYNLRKSEIEQEQAILLSRIDDEEIYFSERLALEESYYEKSKELSLLSFEEQKRLAKGNRTLESIALVEYQKDMFQKMQAHNKKVEALESLQRVPQTQLIEQDINQMLQESGERAIKRMEEQKERADALKQALLELNNQTREYIKSFSSSFLQESGLGSLEIFFDGTFNKLMAGAETSAEKFAVAFNSIAEVAQETFNFLNQNQQAYFDNQYARLEKEKDVAILFAGESETAKAEIERQYEERRREIRRQEAKSQKELAIFNTVINTAQGVVAALANPGGPAGLVLAGVVAAIGAAQIAMISSQQEPEFWKGTMNAPEGWAMVDEKRPEVHTDKHGNIKSMGEGKANRRYLSQGDKIYKSHEFYLDRLLAENGISMHSEKAKESLGNIVINGNNSEIASEIKSLRMDIKSKRSESNLTVSKRGTEEFVHTLAGKYKNLNDRVTFTKKSV